MKKIFKLFFISLFAIVFFSCEGDEVFLTYDSEIISLEYGTSFGECIGYCYRNIDINGTKVEFKASGQTVTGVLPEISFKEEISIEEWEDLTESIDILIFRNMEEVIGCPDCADGGAEWIKITTEDVSHKVIFEYNNEPEEFEDFIEQFRELLRTYESKLN